jgi:flagellar motor switch protein FliM
MVESYLKVSCKFANPELQSLTRTDLSALLPSTACILVIGAAPSEHKIIVELDTGLVGFAIDRLLGGTGEAGRILRPLTEIEQGVFSFLALKIINFVHDGWERGREIALSLDRFASNIDDITDIISSESGYYLVGANFAAGKRVGYARVLLPHALIAESFRAPPAQSGATGEELDYMRSVFRSLPVRNVLATVEGAYLDLGPDDIAQLEPGDIILLENHELSLRSGLVGGASFVKLGTGENGGLRVRVFDDGDQNRLEILDIVVQEKPAEAPMADTENNEEGAVAAPDDNLAGTENLLRDVPAPVVVELGRISMSTAQVVRLRQGEILRLPRGANDPVDLTVNGKLFARGELIEVDGELGVRLLKVVGAPRG